jgi:hypothetical protein
MLYDGCKTCPLRPALCHGVEDGFAVDGCLAFSQKACAEFGWTSLYDPRLFAERFHEVSNFKCQLRRNLLPVQFKLPHYVPALYHGFDRARPLDVEWAAVPLHVLFRSRANGSLVSAVKSPRQLRELLGIRLNAKIIVTGAGPDQGIEDFWGVHQSDNLLRLLRKLDIQLFTAPNYSFFKNAPPPHNRYNRSRTLRVTERAADAGIVSVLHLNAIFEPEWRDWEMLLRRHPEISVVCLEFQTGYARRSVGDRAFNRLVKLQDAVGRPIHPILIGGARYAEKLGRNFPSSTIIDSEPFMKTFYRRNCIIREDGSIEWKFKRSKVDESLMARFVENLSEYSASLYERVHGRLRQMELFRLLNAGKFSPRRKQGKLTDLPLFLSQKPHQQISVPILRSRFGHPNGKLVATRIAIPIKPTPPKIESATSRPNSRRKSNSRKPQPNGSVPESITDAKVGH